MFARLSLLFLLSSAAVAGEFIDNWPSGKTEKLSYEIRTFLPRETENYVHIEITRDSIQSNNFTVRQTLEMPGRSLTIKSLEEYSSDTLRLISSRKHFQLPPKVREKLKTDSLIIEAVPFHDSITISSSAMIAQTGAMPFPDRCVTSTGSQLILRDMNFKIGGTSEYSFINLLKFGERTFKVVPVVDSVTGKEVVTTPAGTFECFKVKNMVPGAMSYSYYSTDRRHIPVRIELIDPKTGEISRTHVMQKYE